MPLPSTAAQPRANLTLQQVAERYHVSTYTVRIWVLKDPKFPKSFRCGGVRGKYLWRLQDLEAYERSLVGGAADAS
jgi:hypothetical protein